MATDQAAVLEELDGIKSTRLHTKILHFTKAENGVRKKKVYKTLPMHNSALGFFYKSQMDLKCVRVQQSYTLRSPHPHPTTTCLVNAYSCKLAYIIIFFFFYVKSGNERGK